jgi:hypothetical protein
VENERGVGKDKKTKAKINVLNQLVVVWKDEAGKEKLIVLDNADISRLFEEEVKKK